VALIRSLCLGLLVYGAITVCYPDWTGEAYHVMALSVIAGGAVGVWALGKILDLGGGTAKIAIELVFLAGIAIGLGYTMPQKSGKPPFQQWSEGVRPSRDAIRRGLDRLGIDR
jgi:hypothetical protein